LGVHRMVHVSGPWSEVSERRVAAAAQSYLADVRVSKRLERMFLETPPNEMYIVTPSDMAESNITFVPSSRAKARLPDNVGPSQVAIRSPASTVP
jgi:hypothetical protein